MNYCKNCKKLYDENIKKCKICSAPLIKDIKNDDCKQIFLISCSGFDKDLITGALKDNNIPFSTSPYKVERYAPEMQRDKLTAYAVYVPLSSLERARDILNGINKDADCQNIVLKNNQNDNDNDEENGGKNIFGGSMLWRIVSVVLFLMLVSLVVFGTDYIISLIKSFF